MTSGPEPQSPLAANGDPAWGDVTVFWPDGGFEIGDPVRITEGRLKGWEGEVVGFFEPLYMVRIKIRVGGEIWVIEKEHWLLERVTPRRSGAADRRPK